MRGTWPILCLSLLSLVTGGLHAQERPVIPPIPEPSPAVNNPHLGNAESIRSGMTLYRVRCADCHGLDARGYRGPDLIALIGGGFADEKLFAAIRKGVPGTEMPPSRAPDEELLQVIAYLRKIGTVTAADGPIGNPENGARLFAAQCASCHRVDGRGGRLGPDLTRIGAARSHAALIREIRTPSEWVAPQYETVTLVLKDGTRIRGAKKNEDVFTIQIMDVRERIQGYVKSSLQEVIDEKGSLMPAYGPSQLSEGDLTDLVGYLSTLRGSNKKSQ